MLTVVDHTEPNWAARYTAKGRENGAATYSRDIVRWHVPAWEQLLPSGSVVSTCPLLTAGEFAGPVAVQYLHTYPYTDPLGQARAVLGHLGPRFERVVFVTAYRALQAQLVLAGLESVFVPMTVDSSAVRAAVGDPGTRRGERQAIYFGNVTHPKQALHQQLRRVFASRGWRLDLLSGGMFCGRQVTQAEAWQIASGYRYGVGVGRCALEMMALGLKVMVAGAEFGGLITTADEWAVQWATNLNGRVTTFDRDIGACVDSLGVAMLVDPPGPSVAIEAIEASFVRELSNA